MSNNLRLKILLVEDHELAQKVAVMILQSLGHEVSVVATGAEVIASIQQNEYDFIFMDIGLPDTNGYVVTATIREFEGEKRHVPIVALTAHVDDQCKTQVFESGMDDFLSKPLTAEKAQAMINKYC